MHDAARGRPPLSAATETPEVTSAKIIKKGAIFSGIYSAITALNEENSKTQPHMTTMLRQEAFTAFTRESPKGNG